MPQANAMPLPGPSGRAVRSRAEALGERGFDQTSVEAIAREAGIAKGTFYLYFESKDALLLEVLRANSLVPDVLALIRALETESLEDAVHGFVRGPGATSPSIASSSWSRCARCRRISSRRATRSSACWCRPTSRSRAILKRDRGAARGPVLVGDRRARADRDDRPRVPHPGGARCGSLLKVPEEEIPGRSPSCSFAVSRPSKGSNVIRHVRGVRVLRVALALARVVPRYWLLLARDRSGRWPTTQADWERTHRAAAREMKQIALTLAGAFTKAAQILGARADVFRRPSSRRAEPVPRRGAAAALRHDGAPRPARPRTPPGRGLRVDRPPGARRASLAQVHRATLRDAARSS